MKKRDAWKRAFPFDEINRAVVYLAEMWEWATEAFPSELKYTHREPTVTGNFCDHLQRHKRAKGQLNGFWQYESPEAIRSEDTEQIVDRIRSDIVYLYNAGEIDIKLVFEFKKLTASNRSRYLKDGVKRFVDDYYAPGEPLALMVGMLKPGDGTQVDKLIRVFKNKGTQSTLRMVPNEDGEYVREPSEFFPDQARFNTEHNRPEDQAPPGGTTAVAHVFLVMPEPEQ